jgi:hypothetical protein
MMPDDVARRINQGTPLAPANGDDVPALLSPGEVHIEPVSPAEFVCTPCRNGQCGRCKDRACTCCYGGDD